MIEAGMVLSSHALVRMQQRALRLRDVAFILDHADREVSVGGGRVACSIRHAEPATLRDALAGSHDHRRLRNVVIVLDAASRTIVTVLRADRRRGKHYLGQRVG